MEMLVQDKLNIVLLVCVNIDRRVLAPLLIGGTNCCLVGAVFFSQCTVVLSFSLAGVSF